MAAKLNEKHVGSDFDDLLREESLLEEVEPVAAKRVRANQISQAMREELAKMANHNDPMC
jgi:hypothetical protein